METPHRIWQAPAAVAARRSRPLAIWRLAADLRPRLNAMLPVKRSVAVVITKGNETLSIRRPENDDELPGIWGLPAGTARASETPQDIITRIGFDKLGVRLQPVSILSTGTQERARYRLEMELWEARMEGSPTCPEWRWAPLDLLRPGAAAGSLCCELALRD